MKKAGFRERVRSRERLVGTFVKTRSPETVEILAGCGFDFLVVDAEHACFDRRDIDAAALAARAMGIPLLVRLPGRGASHVQDALDCGATGILVPHVLDGGDALKVVASSRYREGSRGFSSSPRAAAYGTVGMPELIERGDSETCVVAQVEDAAAVERCAEIAAVDELDCIFIGRADLAVSLGVRDIEAPAVCRAMEEVCKAGVSAGKPLAVFLPTLANVRRFEDMGISLFVIGSDQSMLAQHATGLARDFHNP